MNIMAGVRPFVTTGPCRPTACDSNALLSAHETRMRGDPGSFLVRGTDFLLSLFYVLPR
jgi:hypothetical protein